MFKKVIETSPLAQDHSQSGSDKAQNDNSSAAISCNVRVKHQC